MPTHLPPDLSPWALFLHAAGAVQAVMLGLALASLVTWTILIAKSWELRQRSRELRTACSALTECGQLTDAADHSRLAHGIAHTLLATALAELDQSAGLPDRSGTKERAASRLARVELAWTRRLRQGTGPLATIGATAPFVGLFGTVWGIMHSFIGIAHTHATSLAVVAPGIAEALMATAMGLVAAIPAVVIYNHFTRSLGTLRGLLGDLSTQVQVLLSRDLDRTPLGPA